jgi:hypothetical protein
MKFRVIPQLCKRVWGFGGLIRGEVLKQKVFANLSQFDLVSCGS